MAITFNEFSKNIGLPDDPCFVVELCVISISFISFINPDE